MPQTGVVGTHTKHVSVELIVEQRRQDHHDVAVLDAHPRFLSQLPMVQLPLTARIAQRELPICLFADRLGLGDRHGWLLT